MQPAVHVEPRGLSSPPPMALVPGGCAIAHAPAKRIVKIHSQPMRSQPTCCASVASGAHMSLKRAVCVPPSPPTHRVPVVNVSSRPWRGSAGSSSSLVIVGR